MIAPRIMRRILRDASTVSRWLDAGRDDAGDDVTATRDGDVFILRGYVREEGYGERRGYVDVVACACSACGEACVFDLVIEVGGVEMPVCGGCFGEADVAIGRAA